MTRLLFALLLAAFPAWAECLPIDQAGSNIGRTACVTGKVLKAAQTQSGTWFLDFCENYRECPFTVVVFARDVRDVGDVSKLEGQTIEITGKIQSYGKRAEIILRDARQLKGQAGKLPPAPKDYDVQRHGSFSAGKFKPEKTKTN